MQIETVALNKIIPYIRNPRKNANAIEKVASSIHEFGFRQPIVVDSKNVIIAGHTRFEAAKRLGMDVVPIHVADGLTEQQAKAYRIADNRVGQDVEWDFDLLKLELEELDNPELTGFDEDELNGILAEIGEGLTDPDYVPEVSDDPVTVFGDLWELGEHRVLCGDATKKEDLGKLLQSTIPDMVFTDPPYGIGYEYNSHEDIEGEQYIKFCSNWFENIKRFPLIVMTTGWKYHAFWSQQNPFDMLYWYAPNKMTGGKASNLRNVEPIYVFGEIDTRLTNDWLNHNTNYGTDDKDVEHVCPKPVGLILWLLNLSNGKTVLDMFIGSGSTLIACQKTGRKCFGMEIDPQYCDVIISRWSDFTGKDNLLLNGKQFKWSERQIKKAA